jgi:hypothetical protein
LATLKAGQGGVNTANLSTSQTGTGASTNTLDRSGSQGAALLTITSVVGATPTVTVAIQGSADGVNWWSIPYATADRADDRRGRRPDHHDRDDGALHHPAERPRPVRPAQPVGEHQRDADRRRLVLTMALTVDDLADYQAKDSQQALDAAIAAVQSYCGWHIAPSQSGTASVWSLDGTTLVVPSLNVTAVTSVTQDAVVAPASTYTFESYGVIRSVPGYFFFPFPWSKVTVVFTHGYADWPDDVRGVVLSLAQRSLTDTRGLVAGPSGSAFVETYGPQLSDADKAKLAPYARSAGFA